MPSGEKKEGRQAEGEKTIGSRGLGHVSDSCGGKTRSREKIPSEEEGLEYLSGTFHPKEVGKGTLYVEFFWGGKIQPTKGSTKTGSGGQMFSGSRKS